MEFWVLDTDFKAIGLVENYKSAIWTDRYSEAGDFEIYTGTDDYLMSLLDYDRYLVSKDSEHVMIIEKQQISTDTESGDEFIVTGRSLESILERRIIWNQKNYTGSLQDAIKSMLTEAIISPTIEDRKISNFIFKESTDSRITSLTIDAQYTGDDLYEVIKTQCEEHQIGFKITLTTDNQFEFSLYKGDDRSYAQTANPYVVFSPNFDNIISSEYGKDKSVYRNVTLVAGEGEGASRRTYTVGEASGLDRREVFTDARDISSDTDSGTLSAAQYNEKLKTRGNESLKDTQIDITFEGKMDTSGLFVYNKDFFIGDVVQVADGYGHEGTMFVNEMIMTEDNNGYSAYPTFKEVTETTTT